MIDEEKKQDVLIVIDYQKAFKNENSKKTITYIHKQASKRLLLG